MSLFEMQDNSLYAHSLEGRPPIEWQPLDEHLTSVAWRAESFAASFESQDWAHNAGLFHDIGKADDVFQAYLMRENELDDSAYDKTGINRVNHSSAGAAFAEEAFNRERTPFGRIVSYLVAGHHAGLPDYHSSDGGLGALQIRLREGRENLDRIRCRVAGLSRSWRPLDKLPPYVKANNFHLWARMLFSCLVDADFLDTECFIRPETARTRKSSTTLSTLKRLLDTHMSQMAADSPDTAVNRIRQEVLAACRRGARCQTGLFTLSVPTGGGKTLAAMTFALDHAIHNNKKRVVYVIPYTSIIEQTADILAKILGRENVIEHHSNLDPEKETPRSRLASENWDAPVIVTTNVQFFESLFAARPSRCRKLHNLIDSVVILDEAQLVPPTLLAPCVHVMNELTRERFGVSLVLSTATQPTLPGLREPAELVPADLSLYKRLKRTEVKLPPDMNEPMTWESLALELQRHNQVLCIVNTRRDCYDLFRAMPEETVHLSALMCGEHRSLVIRDIKARLVRKEPVRVISTQLVEAGVDFDFPVVYRALAGMDSIAQAAGRCNREGQLDAPGEVIVFIAPRPAPPGLLLKGENTVKELLDTAALDFHSASSFTRYFEEFYARINDDGSTLLKELQPSDTSQLDVAFRKVAGGFKLIDESNRQAVFVRFAKGDCLIEELRRAGPYRNLLRKLQRYTVNLHKHTVDDLFQKGLLEEVWPGFFAQSGFSIYSDVIGLEVFRDGIPQDDLIGV